MKRYEMGLVAAEEGRLFDTVQNQLAKNGDANKRLVVKMDVEGAEWNSLLHASDEGRDTLAWPCPTPPGLIRRHKSPTHS